MFRILLTSAAFAVSILLHAQKAPSKFGEVPMEDMKMTTYAKDSSANAVVLFDFGNAYLTVINDNVQLQFERHVRIKILNKEGLRWGDVSIPLYHSGSAEERIISFKAATYNLEAGAVVESKLSKDNIFKEKFDNNFNQQKFTFPDVKEGSVIEYSYRLASEFITNFPNWQFQRTIPVRHSEYWAKMPDVFFYERYMQGYVAVNDYTSEKTRDHDLEVTAHHWVAKDVPAFKEEPFMTTEDDYISRINFALSHIKRSTYVEEIMGSWSKFNADLMESSDFGKVISGPAFLKDQVATLVAGVEDPMQKVTTIVNYVKNEIEWTGEKDKYPDNLKKILERKKGTAADINMLMIAMLNKAGLEADPVLLSTRDHGFIRESYPMARQFNYLIGAVKIGDKQVLLDATEKYLPVTALPSRCLNGQGLVISKTRHGWIDISSKAKSKTITSVDFQLEEDGNMKGKITFTRDGYDAHAMRERYHDKGEAEYVKDYTANKTWNFSKTEFADIKEIEKTAKETHEVAIAEHVSAAGEMMYINPFVIPQVDENPFKQDKRLYPVDYGTARENIYMAKFTLPEGYQVEELPKSKVLALPGNAGKFMFSCNQMGNAVTITSNFSINKTLFNQDEYPLLKEFYAQVVAKESEQIVIKKK